MVHCAARWCSNWKSPEVQRSHSKMSITPDHSAASRPLIPHQSAKCFQPSPSLSILQREGCLDLFGLTEHPLGPSRKVSHCQGFEKRPLISRGNFGSISKIYCLAIVCRIDWLCLERESSCDKQKATIMKQQYILNDSFNNWGRFRHSTESNLLRRIDWTQHLHQRNSEQVPLHTAPPPTASTSASPAFILLHGLIADWHQAEASIRNTCSPNQTPQHCAKVSHTDTQWISDSRSSVSALWNNPNTSKGRRKANNLRLDKWHTYMRTLTGMSKNNFVASRKHMKKCQFWKMSSLKGKSKCQRDRYFTHRERCLLGAALKDVRIIFFPCWNEPQLPGIKHTKHGSDTAIAWRAVRSLFATLFRESQQAQWRECVCCVNVRRETDT